MSRPGPAAAQFAGAGAPLTGRLPPPPPPPLGARSPLGDARGAWQRASRAWRAARAGARGGCGRRGQRGRRWNGRPGGQAPGGSRAARRAGRARGAAGVFARASEGAPHGGTREGARDEGWRLPTGSQPFECTLAPSPRRVRRACAGRASQRLRALGGEAARAGTRAAPARPFHPLPSDAGSGKGDGGEPRGALRSGVRGALASAA